MLSSLKEFFSKHACLCETNFSKMEVKWKLESIATQLKSQHNVIEIQPYGEFQLALDIRDMGPFPLKYLLFV